MIDRLLDSVILIDHLNGIDIATEYLEEIDRLKTAVSVITRAEILTGIDEMEKQDVKLLLDQYTCLGIDKAVSDMAADLRQLHGWKLPDAFQAALAKQHKIKLVTRNSRDFDPKRHDFVEIPYRL